MKIKLIKTGKVCEVNNSFGLRMITQGQAVLVTETSTPKKQTEKKPAKTAGEQ